MTVEDCGLNRVELMLLLYGAGFLRVEGGEVAFDRSADPGKAGGKPDLMKVIGQRLASFVGETLPTEKFRYVAVERSDEPMVPGFLETCGIEGLRCLKLDQVDQKGVTSIFPTSSSYDRGARVLFLGLKAEGCHERTIDALIGLGFTVDHGIFLLGHPAGTESEAETALKESSMKISWHLQGDWTLTGLGDFGLI